MMKTSNAAKTSTSAQSQIERLQELLVSGIPQEDLSGYSADAPERAARIALESLGKHEPGQCVIDVRTDSGIEFEGRAVTTVTLVNDNMPFLFDSVIGEITETIGEPSFVAHPIVTLEGEHKISLIHIHLKRLSADDAKALEDRLLNILSQVRVAVNDWKPMLARVEDEIARLRTKPPALEAKAVAEAIAFLEWLRDENFTFLGMREFRYTGSEESGTLERTETPGLGILSNPGVQVLRRGGEATTTTPEIRAFLHGPEPLIVTKANTKSIVHRRAYLDYIGLKLFHDDGSLKGELRIVGLFTSTAYTQSVLNIPYLRSKVKAVIDASGFSRSDHSGKALINILESFPRDELFQISLPLLREYTTTILALGERPRVRVLYRIDQFDRFVSVIIFVPRDRFNSEVRDRIGNYLTSVFDGHVSAYYPAIGGPLTRVHFIIGRSAGKTPQVPAADIESAVRAFIRTWDDSLNEMVEDTAAPNDIAAIARRFPGSYRNSFDAHAALIDAANVAKLSPESPILIDFYRRAGDEERQATLKIFHTGTPVALSQRVPVLENMGFRVISEQTFELGEFDGEQVYLHAMELESASGGAIDLADDGVLFEQVFASVWHREQDSDRLNALAQNARLTVGQIAVLRTYSRYLQQAGITYSQGYIADTLNRYPAIAALLYRLFETRLAPSVAEDARAGTEDQIRAEIEAALEQVPSLDDDTIIRRFLVLMGATLRTNYFAPKKEGAPIVLKLYPHAIEWLPQPRPWREIFVYGAEVEGVHLRFGPVARGGLRWSDRAQDYRTEVLGLVKAQQVKNAVIVPVGAKGGFFPRQLPAGGNRQEIFEAGRAAYITFISSMLSITDNLDGETVIAPEGVVRRDGDDPYFVVAADKGTATFSDTANAISQEHGFWLDDAFASGGSAGYDHKVMGITARGAWEAVKRHFREMNRDIQTEPFTVVGVGDMSGDVFGNGMLLSRQTRLVAAFDHRDIFIDPDPDPAKSFEERQRLFNLPRSSWQDYDQKLLSKGGMIVSRTEKHVTLSVEAAASLGIEKTVVTPNELMSAILRAPVDLLWFGGIGTYVRASTETNQSAGDRANDAIRVAARDLQALVVGEGANLGMTQLARVEFNRIGGRCNSDAIDNSAGVNSSDVEVNIKIALASAVRAGKLDVPSRNKLLADMTDDVAHLVLANNYQQSLAISMIERRGVADLPHQNRLMTLFEGRGLLDRAVEFLPGPDALAERQAKSEGLTRAEIGVLLAYAKLVHFNELVATEVPDEAHFETDLLAYFPKAMRERYTDEIRSHRLRREIIATVLINDIVNRGGATFISQLQDMTGRSTGEIVEAYTIIKDGFGLPELYARIDALDTKVDGQLQLSLYERVRKLVVNGTSWQLKQGKKGLPLDQRISRLRGAVKELEPILQDRQPDDLRNRTESAAAEMVEAGVPLDLARKLALLDALALIPDICLAADVAQADLLATAKAYVTVSEAFQLGKIEAAAETIARTDYYDELALVRSLDLIDTARRNITVAALEAYRGDEDPAAAWLSEGGERVERVIRDLASLTGSGDITLSRLNVAAGLMVDMTG
ncbi:NAD-glutamate dehydrogenase [Nitratireductor aestuarii]|uniref:NAD-glutamate dehydrogenase n=1 Tax=Nitratireductor aestuarii TaxID=1735103 RepID=A0A916RNK0_9HYPH|nr:NAD-glutamate dehydrogenase [Nitratireductor aestuarii]GGA60850.1 NAD-glutamate dehydrogenase [Nitratireductor aestuarii]